MPLEHIKERNSDPWTRLGAWSVHQEHIRGITIIGALARLGAWFVQQELIEERNGDPWNIS